MDELTANQELPLKQYFPPSFSLAAYVYGMILLTALIAGIIGFFFGRRVNDYTTPVTTQQTPIQSAGITLTPTLINDDNDIDYFRVTGTITTDSSYYDQLYVYVDEIKNGVETHQQSDYRMAYKVQPGVDYPFEFGRLDPKLTYIFNASACHSDKQGYCNEVTQKIQITDCSGKIQGNNCVIQASDSGQGYVDFSVKKADNPPLTPTP